MRSLLTVFVVYLVLSSTPAIARNATPRTKLIETTGPTNVTNTTATTGWFSWISYAFRPPSRSEVETGLEVRWKQLEEDVTLQRTRLAAHVDEMSREAQDKMYTFEQNVETKKKELKNRIEADIFKKHRGWKRFRKSVRAQAGIVLGGAMTFAGGALTQTSWQLQAAQLTWGALHKYNVTRGIHEPWLKDATAGALAVTLVAHASGKTIENVTLQRAVPLLTIGLSIAQSVGIIIDNYEGNVTPMTRAAVEAVIATVGTAALSILPIPLTVVAASVAGASLLYQSVITEVVSNWFFLLERGTRRFECMDLEKRRKVERDIRGVISQRLREKLLYPVGNAYKEVFAAFQNETYAGPSLEDKIYKAIQHSLQVKLVWGCAAAGILFQVLWRTKPVERVVSAVRSTVCSWWIGAKRKPKATKAPKKS